MKAIKDTNNVLVAAMDKNDSVGIMDRYFSQASFFTEIERFDRHLEKLKAQGEKVDYLSICTPNYLHDAHIRFGLRYGADVICEKPLVLNPWNIDALQKMEEETGGNVYNILQLRLHPSIIALKAKVAASSSDTLFDCDLTYITSRGNWYYSSWKGDLEKSGGIATNIGVHFFDMLTWVFGEMKQNIVHIHTHDRAAGYFEFEKARVRWFLSINRDTLPKQTSAKGLSTLRSITIDNQEVDFSEGFNDLHTTSYEEILNGKGFKLSEARSAVSIVHDIRNSTPVGIKGDYHPFSKLDLSKHPFKR